MISRELLARIVYVLSEVFDGNEEMKQAYPDYCLDDELVFETYEILSELEPLNAGLERAQ